MATGSFGCGFVGSAGAFVSGCWEDGAGVGAAS